jgi:hypothetical protein
LALVSLTDLQNYQNNLELLSDKNSIHSILKELQGFKVVALAGTTSATNIAVTGIATVDTILKCFQVEPDNGTAATMLTDRTSETSITSAGNIQLSTTNTTGKQLLLFYFDKA